MCVQAWSATWFKDLVELDLSDNQLTTLKGQGLGHLPPLADLDLRHNQLESVEAALAELEQCASLQVLRFQVCVRLCVRACVYEHLVLCVPV